MNWFKKALFFVFLLLYFQISMAQQVVADTIRFEYSKQTPVHILSTPFNTIRVLDNRLDTTCICMVEDGRYPVHCRVLKSSLASAAQNYLQCAISNIQKGNGHLLICIDQLYIPNKNFIPYKNRKTGTTWRITRTGFEFSATAYIEEQNNHYRKIVSINRKCYERRAGSIASLLNQVIEAVSVKNGVVDYSNAVNPRALKYLRRDTAAILYAKETEYFSLDSLNNTITNSWATYPICRGAITMNGIFKNFDDFRNNQPAAARLQVQYNPTDSLYHIAAWKNDRYHKLGYNWAVCDSGNLYLWIKEDQYVKLYRRENTFSFYVPHSLPNMYILLSIEVIKTRQTDNSYNTGNPLASLAAAIVAEGIFAIAKTNKVKKITQNGNMPAFRNCFINMNTGDIVYR